MEDKAGKTCAICRQVKLAQDFPKVGRERHLLAQANICLACRAASLKNHHDDDDSSGGGKQLQHSRDSKQLQYEMELEAALKKEIENQNNLNHIRDIFGRSQLLENERKNQVAQRELLDLKEEMANLPQDTDEPNPELALDTQTRREKITRLFSVTRSLARNYVAANNAKAMANKNFGIFSHNNEEKNNAAKAEQTRKANKDKVLSKESATLFSQSHTTNKETPISAAEKLANAIREGQKIFNR